MSMNTQLLQFLDGTLHPEQEAELLHRLSVSPERRELLRSFFNQQALFQRDRNSIAVPFTAEQNLWARLGEIMPPVIQNAAAPAAAVIETAATTASHTGFFSSVFSVASVAIVCLLIGLGSGFFVGKNSNAENLVAMNSAQSPIGSNPIGQSFVGQSPVGRTLSPSVHSSERIANINHSSNQSHSPNAAQNLTPLNSEAPLSNDIRSNGDVNITNADINNSKVNAEAITNSALPEIAIVTPKLIDAGNLNPIYFRDPSQFYPHSPFDPEESNLPQKTILQRFEFYFNEGIGKQFPNNAATNVSVPVVTNSSISTLFQLFPRSQNLWGGATFGTANVTMKKFRISQKNPLDPKAGYEMVGDLVHVQTTYGGPMLQFRVPEVLKKTALTIMGTAAASSAGLILGGEIGVHVDATSDVGFSVGLRGTHLSYNVDVQQQQVITQGVSSFGVPAAEITTQPSYNLEGSMGIYFHFN